MEIEFSQLLKSLYEIMNYDEIFVKQQKSGNEIHMYLTDKKGKIKVIVLKKDGTWFWKQDDNAKK